MVCVCTSTCVFSWKLLIGELTCRYPLKDISSAGLLPYKQANNGWATYVSTPSPQGPPGRQEQRVEGVEETSVEAIPVHNLMTKGIILLTGVIFTS